MVIRDSRTMRIVITALMTAIEFVVTRFVQIPVPLGYLNFGNSIILFSCVFLPFPCGLFVGSAGAALADLISYPEYTAPTLVIKALLALVFHALSRSGKNSLGFRILFSAAATLIPLFGYTFVGILLSGSFITGIAQFPFLLAEYAANLALLVGLFPLAAKVKFAGR